MVCFPYQQDISSLVPTGVSDDEVESDEDDNHFLSHKIDPDNLKTSGITMKEEQPCAGKEEETLQKPCDPSNIREKMIEEAEKAGSRKCGIDYKSIWMNNSLPCIVAEITSGKLLKGNTFFMKLDREEHGM